MKIIGYLFIVVGFLGGAFTTVLETEQVYWEGFVVAVIAGVAGVVMVRLVISRAARKEETLTVNIRNLLESLSRVVDNITALNQEKESINPYDFRHRIDELFPVDLATFVDAREAISHLYGLQSYADVMSIFSSGERHLNRVWSASADGYIHECHTYIEKAREQFSDALEKLKALETQAS